MSWPAYLVTLAGVLGLQMLYGRGLDRLGCWLGWKIARRHLRAAAAKAELDRMFSLADALLDKQVLTSAGLAQHVPSLYRCGLPDEVWGPGYAWESVRPVSYPPRAPAWLCPSCHHGNHGCQPGACRCPGVRLA